MSFLSSNYIINEIKQLPGLIKSTFQQLTQDLIPGKTISNDVRYIDNSFCDYKLIIDGLSSPVSFVQYDDDIYFVVDQKGIIYYYSFSIASKSKYVYVNDEIGTIYELFDNTEYIQPLFLDIKELMTPVNSMYDERGLLNMIFHPFKKQIFYLYYTIPSLDDSFNCDVILEEWQGIENPIPLRIILRWPHPESNHFGSPIGFHPKDGLLYLATGDGGGVGDKHGPIGNAQNIKSVWGKIMTIDVNTNKPIIKLFSMGHRNPWRGCITKQGKIIVGNVGQDDWEGIEIVEKNDNFGWKGVENGHIYDETIYNELIENNISISSPWLWYGRILGRCVIGGYELEDGSYLFGDYTGNDFSDNVFLVKNDILYLQPKIKDRYKILHSFNTNKKGEIFGCFSDTLGTGTKKAGIFQLLFI